MKKSDLFRGCLGIFIFLSMFLPGGYGEEVELVSLPDLADLGEKLFPMDVASVIVSGTGISQVTSQDQSSFDRDLLLSLIDTDRVSGISISKKETYQFLLSMRVVDRLNQVNVTGVLNGATLTVQVAEIPLLPGEEGWKTVVENKPMRDPVTSVQFRHSATFRALVTIDMHTMAEEIIPTISDISFYTPKDVREYALKKKSDVESQKKKDSPKEDPTVGKHYESRYDVANMYAGANVAYVTSAIEPEKANYINDDNADTFWEFDPKEMESVAVVNLGQTRKIRKISAVHSQKDGDMMFYVLQRLPWENGKNKKLAWYDPLLAGYNETRSDFPLFAQLKGDTKAAPQFIKLKSSWFETLTPFGVAQAGDKKFSQLKAPMVEGQYVLVRFLNRSADISSGFRIYDLNVFVDYKQEDYYLVPRGLPEPE